MLRRSGVHRALIWLSLLSSSQLTTASNCTDSTVRIVTWNLLNFPSQSNLVDDTTTRLPCYRKAMQNINADIIITQENTDSNSISFFLNSVLNANGNNYSAGTYINGYDSDNGIFYRTSCFQFISNTPIHTALRDVSQFVLIHTATNDTIRILSCHLKASSGQVNEDLRAAEADSIRKVTNTFPAGTDFILCGDFNFYSSYEPAYQHLLQNDSVTHGQFVDPNFMSGVWNDAMYSPYHTQSPRTRAFGGGSTGGMDDRFDLILLSTSVYLPGRITYKSNTLTPFGNDGLHYQDSINRPPNAAVTQDVADALHCASDHLPVYADFIFSPPIGIEEVNNGADVNVYPNPSSGDLWLNITREKESELTVVVYDVLSKPLKVLHEKLFNGEITIPLFQKGELLPGIYYVSVYNPSGYSVSKLITIE